MRARLTLATALTSTLLASLRVSFLASFLGGDHGQVHMFEVDLTCAP